MDDTKSTATPSDETISTLCSGSDGQWIYADLNISSLNALPTRSAHGWDIPDEYSWTGF